MAGTSVWTWRSAGWSEHRLLVGRGRPVSGRTHDRGKLAQGPVAASRPVRTVWPTPTASGLAADPVTVTVEMRAVARVATPHGGTTRGAGLGAVGEGCRSGIGRRSGRRAGGRGRSRRRAGHRWRCRRDCRRRRRSRHRRRGRDGGGRRLRDFWCCAVGPKSDQTGATAEHHDDEHDDPDERGRSVGLLHLTHESPRLGTPVFDAVGSDWSGQPLRIRRNASRSGGVTQRSWRCFTATCRAA